MGRDDMCEDCRRLTAGDCGKHEDSWAPRPPLVVGRIDLSVQTNALAPASAQIESLGRLVGEQAKRIAALEAERDKLRATLDHVWGRLEPDCGKTGTGQCGPVCELRLYIDRALGRAGEAPKEP